MDVDRSRVVWKEQVKELADFASYMDRQMALLQAGLADSALDVAICSVSRR